MRRVLTGLAAAGLVMAAFAPAASAHGGAKVLMFTSDGMRQDAVERYARQGAVPGFAQLLDRGAHASGHGLLTQAPPNTGAGWYTLMTGAWPAVHGSTNNTFHIVGTPFTSSTPAFTAGVPQAQSIAQAAEAAGKKVAQIEWSGGHELTTAGPTVDYRNFRSGRGVATNYVSPTDNPALITSLGLQYDRESPAPAAGWTDVPRSYSPAQEMRLRVVDFGVDRYGLNAYIYDSTNDRRTNYDHVLFSRSRSGRDSVGDLRAGGWADVKVTIATSDTDPLNGKTSGMLIHVETLSGDLSQVRLFHTSVTRAIATWPSWPGARGFTGDFEDFIAQRFPSAQSADFAVIESGIVSEDTYVHQALYWETAYRPIIRYVLSTYKPDLALVGYSETDEFQHQFLGLVTPRLPNGARNPAYDDIQVNGTPDHRVAQREAYIRRAYEGADATMRLAQHELGSRDLTTFVASDHGFAPQFAAVDASLPLVQLGLLSKPQTGNCLLATGETVGQAKACWAGGTAQIYLNVAGRDPATPGLQQIQPADVPTTVQRIRQAFQSIQDPNDWSGDGKPEGWKVIDRTYTRAEAARIPNGDGHTADMSNPTRTGDLVVFAYPPYEFDAETPGTLIARSSFFGQHGYVPDVQALGANTNMRATFLAGGPRIARGTVFDMRSIDEAPTAAFVLGVPAPAQSQGAARHDLVR